MATFKYTAFDENEKNLKGFINIENSLKSKYYNFDYNNEIVTINGIINLNKDPCC